MKQPELHYGYGKCNLKDSSYCVYIVFVKLVVAIKHSAKAFSHIFSVVCVCVKHEHKCMYLLLMCVNHSSLVFIEPFNNGVLHWLG